MNTSNLRSLKKSPLSWKIWLGLWVLPLLTTVPFTYPLDPFTSIVMLIFTGTIVYTMIFKPQWTKGWMLFVTILDLSAYVFGIGVEQMTSVDFGNALKEIIFLLYLYFSNNAIAYQQRFGQKKENYSLDEDFKSD